MTIYVSHTIIASIARKVLERLGVNELAPNVVALFIVCIGVPLAGYYVLKKLGWLHYFGLATPGPAKQ